MLKLKSAEVKLPGLFFSGVCEVAFFFIDSLDYVILVIRVQFGS